MALKYTNGFKINQHFLFQGHPKCFQIGIFGIQIPIPSGKPVWYILVVFLFTLLPLLGTSVTRLGEFSPNG
jgi:hypothetical protein